METTIKLPKKVLDELEHYKITKLPRCIQCKKPFKKINEQSSQYNSVWETNCKCFGKPRRLCIG